MIGFAMTISVFFIDQKVAMQMTGLISLLPLIIFVAMTANKGQDLSQSNIIVTMISMPLPTMPVMCLLAKMTYTETSLFNLKSLNTEFCWFMVVADVFICIAVFYYLDQIFPGPYGIKKSACFCIKKPKR